MMRHKMDVVYFLMVVVSGGDGRPRIKIGFTGDHRKRLSQHVSEKMAVAFDVKEIAVVRGDRADEQQVLRYFKSALISDRDKETFWPTRELVGYLRWLRDQWFVWVPDCDLGSALEELEVIDSTAWMPSADRQKECPTGLLFCGDYGDLRLPPRETSIDDFYTSEEILEPVRRVMGRIDMDPASHAVANMKVRALRFFSKHDNGLVRQWSGTVWVNPPFSCWSEWTPKVIAEWKSGRVEAMCVLAATRTLTAQYFAPIHEHCNAICILRGRIPFWGDRAKQPDDGHAIFYFGESVDGFVEEMSSIGHVYRSENIRRNEAILT